MRPGLLIVLLAACNGATPVDTDPAVFTPPPCPSFAPASLIGVVETPPAVEISGMAVGDGVIWVHNDGGENAAVHAISPQGGRLSTWTLDGVVNLDFEDMARAPGPDGGMWLWIADIGDNAAARTEIQVYRFPEPDPMIDGSVTPERLDLIYPDGPRDAESLLVDPVDGTLWIVEKSLDGVSGFYRLLRPMPGPSVLERALTKTFGQPPLGQATTVTGGDLDERGLVVRTYLEQGFVWPRAEGEPVIDALQRDPCTVTLAPEPQGEAIAWGPDGLYTISEGDQPGVHFHAFE